MSQQALRSRRLLVGVTAGLLTAALWGSWAVVSRIGLTGALDHRDITMLRYVFAGVAMLPLVLRRGVRRHGIAGVPWHHAVIMMLGAGAPYSLLVFAGIERAPANHQAIIGPAGVMLFTVVFSRLLLGERMKVLQYLGVVLIGAGVLGLGSEALLQGASDIGFAHLLFVLATVLWSGFTVMSRHVRTDAFTSTAIVSTGSLLVYTPIYFWMTGNRLFSLPVGDLLFQGVFQGFVIGLIALVLYMHTVNLLGAGLAAMFAALVPAMGSVLAYAVLDEPLTRFATFGLVLVTAGMVMAIVSGAVGPGRAAASAGQSGGIVPGSKPPGN